MRSMNASIIISGMSVLLGMGAIIAHFSVYEMPTRKFIGIFALTLLAIPTFVTVSMDANYAKRESMKNNPVPVPMVPHYDPWSDAIDTSIPLTTINKGPCFKTYTNIKLFSLLILTNE